MSEWISVEDRLPEMDVDVQVYCADSKEQMVAARIPGNIFRFATSRSGLICCEPTHWMPLPEPPEAA